MPVPGDDRFFTELRGCTAELARIIDGDLERPVPTCPGWTFRQLATHVGRGHRWAAQIVAIRSATPIPLRELADLGPATFWARRRAHETAVHLADAQLAAGRDVDLAPEAAADGVDEWLGLVAASTAGTPDPARAQDLRGDGQSLHFHATDPGLSDTGEWLVTRTPSGVTVTRGHGKADVAVRGPAARQLLVLTRRLPPSD